MCVKMVGTEMSSIREWAPQIAYFSIVGFYSLRPSQQFFSHVRTGLPGLNQY